ncbi:MAG: PKD domain-containing protein, partial [Chitinophagales bacterium]|nr:PKD domain-containing protein [Chitinophagales bacterium]
MYLDVVEPVGDTLQKRPLIIHAFGGGFLIGWRTEPVIPQMAESYAKRGFVFATIDYRLGFNALDGQSAERAVYRGAQDMAAALRFLVDNADTYGIDTNAIFLTGTSAGCFSALVNGFMEEADRADIPSTYGILLEPDNLGCLQCAGNNNHNNQRVQIHGIINNWGAILDTNYINPTLNPLDNIPVMSFHGTNDLIVPYAQGYPFQLPIFPLVQGSLLIHQRLDNVGIKNRLYPLQGLGHEPELLQLQEWVTDTILNQGSLFLYEILYGDSIEIQGDPSLCKNDIHTYSLPLHTGSRYCWEAPYGNIISINNNSIQVQWDTIGMFPLISTELTKQEISKTDTLWIDVKNPPQVYIDYQGFDGQFTFQSPSNANQYQWDFGDGTQGSGSPINHTYTDTSFYNVSLQIADNYCTNSLDTLIQANTCPTAEIHYMQNDSVILFYAASALASAHTWISPDGSVLHGDTLSYNLQHEGVVSLMLIAENRFCADTLTFSQFLHFCSHAHFTFETNNLEANFTFTGNNAYFYNWDFGDGSVSALENPSHTYNQSSTYNVQLITGSTDGCLDTFYLTVLVDLGSGIYNINSHLFEIFPNPAQNRLEIKNNASVNLTTYSIYSTE